MSTSLSPLEHESKFVLAPHALAAARAVLDGCCRVEAPFGESRVDSIYFDTPRLDLYGEKAASDLKKTKVRVRWYDGGGAVFAEVKRRYGTRRAKTRFGSSVLALDLEARGLDAAGLRAVPRELAAAGESLPAALEPGVRIGYLRRRWLCPGGARISLDSEVRASAWSPRFGGSAPGVELSGAVLEVKGRQPELPAVLAPLAALGCRRGSFSKYGFLMAALRGEETGDA